MPTGSATASARTRPIRSSTPGSTDSGAEGRGSRGLAPPRIRLEKQMSLMEMLKHALLDLKASWVMWILLVLSVVDLVLIGERALFLFWVRDDVGKLSDDLDKLLRKGMVREALEELEKSPSAEAAVVVAGLRHADLGPIAAE